MATFSRWLRFLVGSVWGMALSIPLLHIAVSVTPVTGLYWILLSLFLELVSLLGVVLPSSGWVLVLMGAHWAPWVYLMLRRSRGKRKTERLAREVYREPLGSARQPTPAPVTVSFEGLLVLFLHGLAASVFLSSRIAHLDTPSLPWSSLLHDPSIVVGVPVLLAMWAMAWLDLADYEGTPRPLAPVLVMVGVGLGLGAVALGAVPLDAWHGRSQGRAARGLEPAPDALGSLIASHADKPDAAFYLSYGWLKVWLGAYALLVIVLVVHGFLVLRPRPPLPAPST